MSHRRPSRPASCPPRTAMRRSTRPSRPRPRPSRSSRPATECARRAGSCSRSAARCSPPRCLPGRCSSWPTRHGRSWRSIAWSRASGNC
ncbi:MAG: hypothetical protein FJ191_08015 [Gammaproteobacteria bacterium]|nr:hypothetical protein [Gammaproteobacteria bacterium]